ncbi:hypothetical protein N9F12_01340 [Burkholderiaceae bacterium]|nr:hypothetical protein [Burkholderiaceae bacterium]
MDSLKLRLIQIRLSSHLALASTLATLRIQTKISPTELEKGIQKDIFENMLGEFIIDEFERIKNAEYRSNSISLLKADKHLLNLYKVHINGNPKDYISNLVENIEKGYLNFEIVDDIKQGYVIGTSASLGAAAFIISEFGEKSIAELSNIGVSPEDFKKMMSSFQKDVNLLKSAIQKIRDAGKEGDYLFNRAVGFTDLINQSSEDIDLKGSVLAYLKTNQAGVLLIKEGSIIEI